MTLAISRHTNATAAISAQAGADVWLPLGFHGGFGSSAPNRRRGAGGSALARDPRRVEGRRCGVALTSARLPPQHAGGKDPRPVLCLKARNTATVTAAASTAAPRHCRARPGLRRRDWAAPAAPAREAEQDRRSRCFTGRRGERTGLGATAPRELGSPEPCGSRLHNAQLPWAGRQAPARLTPQAANRKPRFCRDFASRRSNCPINTQEVNGSSRVNVGGQMSQSV